jgi:cation:H+ antiporter
MTTSILLIVGGLAAAILASRVVVDRARAIAAGTSISPFVIGLILLAIGTDLPEIANSVAASLSGHGDINVGDSIGSAVTQSTLVLALLPFIGGAFGVDRRDAVSTGGATVIALLLGAGLMLDGDLTRIDGGLLVGFWALASFAIFKFAPPEQLQLPIEEQPPRRTMTWLEAAGALAVVGGGAFVAVQGFVGIAESMELPEYIVSFFLASIGTSLPELVVDATALRKGEREMAIGGLLGASLLDATVSIGSGPIVAPNDVTAELALRGSLLGAVVLGVVAVVLAWRRRHDWRSAVLFVLLYAAFFPALLG